MSDTEYTSRDAMLGKPVTVRVGGNEIAVPLLSMSATSAWLAYVDAVNEAEKRLSSAEDKTEARQAFVDAMVNAVTVVTRRRQPSTINTKARTNNK